MSTTELEISVEIDKLERFFSVVMQPVFSGDNDLPDDVPALLRCDLIEFHEINEDGDYEPADPPLTDEQKEALRKAGEQAWLDEQCKAGAKERMSNASNSKRRKHGNFPDWSRVLLQMNDQYEVYDVPGDRVAQLRTILECDLKLVSLAEGAPNMVIAFTKLQLGPAKRARGTCPECKQHVRLKQDGTPGLHKVLSEDGVEWFDCEPRKKRGS